MPASYTLHPELRVVATRFTDPVSDEDFEGLYRALFADPRYALGTAELADLRDAPAFAVSTRALRRVADMTRSHYRDGVASFRTAVVAPTDLGYGLARMYEALLAEGPESVRVFRELPEAFAWLETPIIEGTELHAASS